MPRGAVWWVHKASLGRTNLIACWWVRLVINILSTLNAKRIWRYPWMHINIRWDPLVLHVLKSTRKYGQAQNAKLGKVLRLTDDVFINILNSWLIFWISWSFFGTNDLLFGWLCRRAMFKIQSKEIDKLLMQLYEIEYSYRVELIQFWDYLVIIYCLIIVGLDTLQYFFTKWARGQNHQAQTLHEKRQWSMWSFQKLNSMIVIMLGLLLTALPFDVAFCFLWYLGTRTNWGIN